MKLPLSTFALLVFTIAQPLRAQTVATVGASKIIHRQLQQRIAIEQAYGGTLTREAAFVSLVNDALDREVARILRQLPDSVELQHFSEHADLTSKAPEILTAVKQIFGKDSSEYRWLYLSPRLINMKLHQFFVRDTVLHSMQRRAIEYAYLLAAKGMSFKQAAERSDLKYYVDSVSDRREELPAALAQYAATDSAEKDPYVEMVSHLSVGQLFGTIVETDGDYRVLRLIDRNDSAQMVEVISAGKGDFDEWFRSQAARVEIRIGDHGLRRSIIEKYSQLWWVQKIIGSDGSRGKQ